MTPSFERLVYALRLTGVGWAVLVGGYFVAVGGRPQWYHWLLLGIVLIYPHLAHLSYLRRRSAGAQLRYLLVDSLFLGVTCFVTNFSLLPSLTAASDCSGRCPG